MSTGSINKEKLQKAICRFAARFHRSLLDSHHIGSPLGAWCLLAYVANNVQDEDQKQELASVLGVSADEAYRVVLELLETKPEIIRLAMSAWVAPNAFQHQESFREWLESVESTGTARVSVPAKDELDAWVAHETGGLIEKFPVTINPNMFVSLFATAIAVDVEWRIPYDTKSLVTAHPMNDAWNVLTFLTAKNDAGTYVVQDETGRQFAVHERKDRTDELKVFSVLPLGDSVSDSDLLDAAHAISAGKYQRAPLEDVLENDFVKVSTVKSSYPQAEKYDVVLPAWETNNNFDLPDLGFEAALRRFKGDKEVRQDSVAKYHSQGFKAAALTYAMVSATGFPMEPVHDSLLAEVSFARSYAVVAVSSCSAGLWSDLPVFSGIVREAVEAKPEDA